MFRIAILASLHCFLAFPGVKTHPRRSIMTLHALSSLGEATDRKLDQLAETSREKFDMMMRKNLRDLSRDTKEWLKRNPGKTLLGTLATGFLVGWLIRKK